MLAIPRGLSREGRRAAKIILQCATRVLGHAPNTGGCVAFRTPAAHAESGEPYAHDGELVVVYDGGDLRPFFSCGDGIAYFEYMATALEEAGFYAEPGTSWYCAIRILPTYSKR